MDNLYLYENDYRNYIENFHKGSPEALLSLDLALLNQLDLLDSFQNSSFLSPEASFRVFETDEKITLINSHFIIWIIPQRVESMPITYILIASLEGNQTHFELAFSATGIYNNSRLILRVLEKLLLEINETNKELNKFANF